MLNVKLSYSQLKQLASCFISFLFIPKNFIEIGIHPVFPIRMCSLRVCYPPRSELRKPLYQTKDLYQMLQPALSPQIRHIGTTIQRYAGTSMQMDKSWTGNISTKNLPGVVRIHQNVLYVLGVSRMCYARKINSGGASRVCRRHGLFGLGDADDSGEESPDDTEDKDMPIFIPKNKKANRHILDVMFLSEPFYELPKGLAAPSKHPHTNWVS